jgi:hypothetical protein
VRIIQELNNAIKDLPCYYAITPIEKKEGSLGCSKFAVQNFLMKM